MPDGTAPSEGQYGGSAAHAACEEAAAGNALADMAPSPKPQRPWKAFRAPRPLDGFLAGAIARSGNGDEPGRPTIAPGSLARAASGERSVNPAAGLSAAGMLEGSRAGLQQHAAVGQGPATYGASAGLAAFDLLAQQAHSHMVEQCGGGKFQPERDDEAILSSLTLSKGGTDRAAPATAPATEHAPLQERPCREPAGGSAAGGDAGAGRPRSNRSEPAPAEGAAAPAGSDWQRTTWRAAAAGTPAAATPKAADPGAKAGAAGSAARRLKGAATPAAATPEVSGVHGGAISGSGARPKTAARSSERKKLKRLYADEAREDDEACALELQLGLQISLPAAAQVHAALILPSCLQWRFRMCCELRHVVPAGGDDMTSTQGRLARLMLIAGSVWIN